MTIFEALAVGGDLSSYSDRRHVKILRQLPSGETAIKEFDIRSKDIIASIMFLANSLDFEVIAEFVETKFERKTLESLGCSLYQGYYYGEALSLKDFLEKIK